MKNLLFIIPLFPLILFGQQGMLLQTGVPLTPVYETEYQDVLDYASGQSISLPSTTNQVCQNALVDSLKTAGYYSLMDAIWPMAGSNSDFAKINWEDPGNHSLTVQGSLNYTSLDGFEKASTNNTDYLETNFTMSTDCVHCTQDDFMNVGYFKLNGDGPNDGNFYRLFGANITGMTLRHVGGTKIIYANINSPTFVSATKTVANTGGTIGVYRNTSTTAKITQDNTQTDANSTSTGESAFESYILGLNSSGSPQPLYGGIEASVFLVGEFPGSDSDMDRINDILDTYMNCIE